MKKPILLFFALLLLNNFSWSQSNGTIVFDETYIHEIQLTFEQVNFWDSLDHYYNEWFNNGAENIEYMMAAVTIDGNEIDSIGIRQKGFYSNWGAWTDKKPLKLKFNKYVSGRKYDGLKKINLQNGFQDAAMIRDALSYKFMRDAGIPASRTAYAKVYLNGEYWGLYIMVEQVDNKFLKNWFDDNDGDLFKCMAWTNLDWQGNNEANYTDEFELKTNEETSDFTDFINWVDVINNSADADFKDNLANIFETEKYLKVLASDIIMLNWDSYYDHGRNFYVYQNPDDNKFNWIPWDYNLSFSDQPIELIIDYSDLPFSEPKPLVINTQENDDLRAVYFSHLCYLINNYFNLDHLEEYIDNTVQLIRPPLVLDENKFFPNIADFDMAIDQEIKQFITQRYEDVVQQLDGYGYSCITGIEDVAINDEFLMYPNPANQQFNIKIKNNGASKFKEFQVLDVLGRKIIDQQINGPNITVNCSDWTSGIYLVVLFSEANVFVKKINVKR